MLQNRNYDKVKEFDQIELDAGAVATIDDVGGFAKVTTDGNHGITQSQVDDGHKLTISGSDVGAYNVQHKVTSIVSVTEFITDIVFTTTGTGGTFLVQKIYILSPGLLTSAALAKATFNAELFVALQEVKKNDKHSTNIVWVNVSTGDVDYFKGDSSLITAFKFEGNPLGTVKFVLTQMNRW